MTKPLVWNQEVEEKLKKRFFDHSGKIDYGSHCVYVEIEDRVAAKLYFSEKNRDYSLKNQQKAFEKNVGPQVGDSFSIRFLCIVDNEKDGLDGAWRRPLFGYLTEIADSLKSTPEDEEFEKLVCNLKSIGLSDGDCNHYNLGRIGKKLVMIDFDKESHGHLAKSD